MNKNQWVRVKGNWGPIWSNWCVNKKPTWVTRICHVSMLCKYVWIIHRTLGLFCIKDKKSTSLMTHHQWNPHCPIALYVLYQDSTRNNQYPAVECHRDPHITTYLDLYLILLWYCSTSIFSFLTDFQRGFTQKTNRNYYFEQKVICSVADR